MTIAKPHKGADGLPAVDIHIGDQYVTLAAHALVEALRAPSDRIRTLIAGHFESCADDAGTDALTRVYGALAVLLAEVRAEELRMLASAGVV